MAHSMVQRFLRERLGVAAVEFGLSLPILMLILTGCFEASRYILLHQKLDRASTSVADLVAQNDGVSTSVLTGVYAAADEQTLPFDLVGRGRVIISSIYKEAAGDNPEIKWQCQGGGVLASQTSKLGVAGNDAILPSTLPAASMSSGENIIVAEVLYDYEPFLFSGFFPPKVVRHTSYTRPRGPVLITAPTCP